MSNEEPSVETPPPPAAPETPAPSAHASRDKILLIVGVVLAVLVAGFWGWQNRSMFGITSSAVSYTVEPFTPPSELVSAADHVAAHAAPDITSPTVVMFGPNVTLNVTGRVSAGLGSDWYAVSWNNQTAFVRQQDAIAGNGAPPTPTVREAQPEEEKQRPEDEEEVDESDDVVAEAPPPPSSGTLEMSQVNWLREPNARDFARYYPNDALDNGRSGRVVLDCEIGGGGRLDCSVANESPGGNGFGQAAINISRQVRVAPTLPDGSPSAGRRMRMPLAFRAG